MQRSDNIPQIVVRLHGQSALYQSLTVPQVGAQTDADASAVKRGAFGEVHCLKAKEIEQIQSANGLVSDALHFSNYSNGTSSISTPMPIQIGNDQNPYTFVIKRVGVEIQPGETQDQAIERAQLAVLREISILNILPKAWHEAEYLGEEWLEDGEPVNFLFKQKYNGRDLDAVLKDSSITLTLLDTYKIARLILKELVIIHEAGIIHQDLKPQNILLNQDKYGEWCVRIVDFGLARINTEETSQDIMGTVFYISPEMFRHGCAGSNQSTDIYSIFMVLTELFRGVNCRYKILLDYGDLALRLLIQSEDIENIAAGAGFLSSNAELFDFFMRGVAFYPEHRPTLKEGVDYFEQKIQEILDEKRDAAINNATDVERLFDNNMPLVDLQACSSRPPLPKTLPADAKSVRSDQYDDLRRPLEQAIWKYQQSLEGKSKLYKFFRSNGRKDEIARLRILARFTNNKNDIKDYVNNRDKFKCGFFGMGKRSYLKTCVLEELDQLGTRTPTI